MSVITITNMNDGVNIKSDPAAISEGGVVDCVGFDLAKEGVLETSTGIAVPVDIIPFLPTGDIECFRIEYIGLVRYVLATNTTGLYANGLLVQAGFTGRFVSVGFINNIYLTNGSTSIRFDGTFCFQWGITAPTTVPTITPGTYLEKVIDPFEEITIGNWAGHEIGPTITLENTIVKEGSHSMKWTCPVGTSSSYETFAASIDGTTFSNGHASVEDDYVRFWLYIDTLENLYSLATLIDVGDGTFANDYFTYTIFGPLSASGVLNLGQGQSTTVPADQTAEFSQPVTAPLPSGTPPEDQIPTVSKVTKQNQTQVLTKNPSASQSAVTPILSDQTLNYWSTSDLMQWHSASWKEIKIPKSAFIQIGDNDWSAIKGVKFVINTTALYGLHAYFDGLKIVGGSDFEGDYWFLYTWGRTDGGGNIVHESSPSRTVNQFNIIGPVTFDRQPFTYSTRPLSSDPQVDCAVIYAIGGTLVDWWDVVEVLDNTTATATLYDVGDKYVNRKLVSQHNFPAPPGLSMTVYQNKIWMVGDPSYPNLVRSSDILPDGSVAPEGWPTRNGYDLNQNHGPLVNIREINKQMVVKGTFGEWLIRVLDATDYTQIQALRVSPMGLIGKDAVVEFETSNVYPSPGGFIESDGSKSNFVMPEIQPLSTPALSTAHGVNAGLISYFSYSSSLYGDRTAVIDMFRGKPRFGNVSDLLFTWLYKDVVTDTVYGIYAGGVYILGSGYTNEAIPGKQLNINLRSRTFRPGGVCCWQKMEMTHNTGGAWWRLEVYVDDKLIAMMPFKSSVRIRDYFSFGPSSGHHFYFKILGDYTSFGEIIFPIRIYHGGK